MALTASSTFNVAAQAPEVASVSAIVQPPVGYGTGGRGRLVHPTLGTYDYANTPDETVGIDGDLCVAPIWAHAKTLGGGVDVLWPGNVRDVEVIERWKQGDVGAALAHLRQLWSFFSNPPDPAAGEFIVWAPNYATARTYRVALVDLTAGGAGYTLDRRLAAKGYAPQPVELKLRVIDAL